MANIEPKKIQTIWSCIKMKDNSSMNDLIDLFFDPDYVKVMSQLYAADVDKLSDSELDKMIDLLCGGAKIK